MRTSRSRHGRRGRQGGRRDVTIDEPGGLSDRRATTPPARGLILADTKFEWGFDDETGELLAGRRGAHARQLAVLVNANRIVPAGRSRRSTSSSSATGSKRRAGTRRARRRGCPRTSSRRRAASMSRRIERLTGQCVSLEITPLLSQPTDCRCTQCHAPIPDRRRIARAGTDRDRRGLSVGHHARYGAHRPRARAPAGRLRARQAAEARDRPDHRRVGRFSRRDHRCARSRCA